jgi:hypothetical protein
MNHLQAEPVQVSSRKSASFTRQRIFFPTLQGERCIAVSALKTLKHRALRTSGLILSSHPDVMEHVLNPAAAFSETARTLKPKGAHVFTVPWYYWQKTKVRPVPHGNRGEHLEPPDYHGNPIDAQGSLVVTEWGDSLCDYAYEHSRLSTTAIRIFDRRHGIDAKFIEVFVSRKEVS